MKNRDWSEEQFSDVKNLEEHTFFPGEFAPYDLSLFYPGGFVP